MLWKLAKERQEEKEMFPPRKKNWYFRGVIEFPFWWPFLYSSFLGWRPAWCSPRRRLRGRDPLAPPRTSRNCNAGKSIVCSCLSYYYWFYVSKIIEHVIHLFFLVQWFIGCLIGWSIDWLTDYLIGWLICLSGWLIDWWFNDLIDLMIDWFNDWLIQW